MSAIISQNKVLSGDDIFANLDWCRDRNKKPRTEVVLTPQGGTIDCLLYYNVAFSVFSPTCDAKDCEFEGEEGFSSPDWSRDNCFPTAYLGYRRSDKKMKPC